MPLRVKHNQLEYRFQFGGRRYSKQTGLADTARNRTLASQMEAQHRAAIEQAAAPKQPQPWGTPRAPGFNEVLMDFSAYCDLRYQAHPSSSRRIAGSLASAAEYFGQTSIGHIDAAALSGYMQWRDQEHQVRPVTLRHDLHALSVLFQWAQTRGWMNENPTRQVPIPSDREAVRQHIVTAEEEQAYLAAAAGQSRDLHDVAVLILTQGMRPAEVCALQVADVEIGRRRLHVRASKSTAGKRSLWLTSEALEILTARVAAAAALATRWLFPQQGNPAVPIERVNNAHARVRKLHPQLQFCLYDLRHTFATRAAEAGINGFALAAILGHASTRTLPRYVHPTQQYQDQAMQLLNAKREEPNTNDKRHAD